MEQAAQQQLAGIRLAGTHHVARSCEMRFIGQGYEINVMLPPGPYRSGDAAKLRDAFFTAYASAYGDRAFERSDPVEGVHWKLTARLNTADPGLSTLAKGDGDIARARKASRSVYFPEAGGFTDCPVFDRAKLLAGDTLFGPAIIEERDSTLVLPPQASARVDAHGHVILDLLTSAETAS
jgi:N-methylhydantoinase A